MRASIPIGKEAITPSGSAITLTAVATSLRGSLAGASSPPSGSPTIPPLLYVFFLFKLMQIISIYVMLPYSFAKF